MLVVGGDSAVEADGPRRAGRNQVTLSPQAGLQLIKSRNEERLERMIAEQRLEILFESEVKEIRGQDVVLEVTTAQGPRLLRLPNDDVFVFAGGVPPFQLLEAAGVSFDPEQRQAAEAAERGTGLPGLAGRPGPRVLHADRRLAFTDYRLP
ncbi:MAG: NAD(P)-binding domain-containing protein [Planctomycetota bacterium]